MKIQKLWDGKPTKAPFKAYNETRLTLEGYGHTPTHHWRVDELSLLKIALVAYSSDVNRPTHLRDAADKMLDTIHAVVRDDVHEASCKQDNLFGKEHFFGDGSDVCAKCGVNRFTRGADELCERKNNLKTS
jgi:hypothetical protein